MSRREIGAPVWLSIFGARSISRWRLRQAIRFRSSSVSDAFSKDKLGLIFDREQFLEAAFAHEHAVGENADAIADLLRLREKVRREQDRYSTPLKIDNQIANFARARPDRRRRSARPARRASVR